MPVPVVPKPVTNTSAHVINATRLPAGTRNVSTSASGPLSEPLPTYAAEREDYGLPYNVYEEPPRRQGQQGQSQPKLDFGSAAEFAMTFEGQDSIGPLGTPTEGTGEFSLRALVASGVYSRNASAGVPIEGVTPPGRELNIEL